MLNNGKSNISKSDSKADEGIFLGYSLTSKPCRIYNKLTLTVEEYVHVAFDECLDDLTNTFHLRESLDVNETNANVKRDMEEVQEEHTFDKPEKECSNDLLRDMLIENVKRRYFKRGIHKKTT